MMKKTKNKQSKKNFQTKFIQYVFNVLTWVTTTFQNVGCQRDQLLALQPLLLKMDLILKNRGPSALTF